MCAALTDGDREAVRRGVAEPGVRMIAVPPDVFHAAYNDIANSVLWFVHHLLYRTPFEPVFDEDFRGHWAAYEAYNAAFADALAEEAAEGAAVLVQDYHLALVPALLRERRPDLRIGHFSHTPWAPPDYFRLLPDDVAAQLLEGVLGADRAAFLTHRWAAAFAACCADVLGAEVAADGGSVTHRGRTTRLGVHGLGADAEFLRERAQRPDVDERMAALRAEAGPGRRLIVRVDRTELSKNIVRGLLAYRRLLIDHPGWRERVVHVAFAYPSRQDLASYRDYTAEVSRVATAINDEFGTEGWTPVILKVDDDFARSLAAYRLADVALVNPIRDGMNLVAKEVPVVSDRGVALVLSREAGAFEELGEGRVRRQPVRRPRDRRRAQPRAHPAGGRTGRPHQAPCRRGHRPPPDPVVPRPAPRPPRLTVRRTERRGAGHQRHHDPRPVRRPDGWRIVRRAVARRSRLPVGCRATAASPRGSRGGRPCRPAPAPSGRPGRPASRGSRTCPRSPRGGRAGPCPRRSRHGGERGEVAEVVTAVEHAAGAHLAQVLRQGHALVHAGRPQLQDVAAGFDHEAVPLGELAQRVAQRANAASGSSVRRVCTATARPPLSSIQVPCQDADPVQEARQFGPYRGDARAAPGGAEPAGVRRPSAPRRRGRARRDGRALGRRRTRRTGPPTRPGGR